MNNHEIVCGIAAVRSITDAYLQVKDTVLNELTCRDAAAMLLDTICAENTSLLAADCVQNTTAEGAMELGICAIDLPEDKGLIDTLKQKIPRLLQNGCISLPVRLDDSGCIRMVLECSTDTNLAASLAQSLLIQRLKSHPGSYFRCVDMVSGGNFFSYLHSVMAELPTERTGGGVYVKSGEMDALIKHLEEVNQRALSTIGANYTSVYAYNQMNEEKLPEYMVILRLSASDRNKEEWKRLQILMENAAKAGISFLVIGEAEVAGAFMQHADYHFKIKGEKLTFGREAELPFTLTMDCAINNEQIVALIAEIHKSSKVDSVYTHHPELQQDIFAMDAGSGIRIPFALDNNNRLRYFEIGGDAPAHALIAGTTGSGKSVLLHTLILQTVQNYHPDDVEIWAIDYKAVEFAGYMKHRTPHFRVIAHDTSSEFSLSLVDKIYQEYERRMELFLEAGVKGIGGYRAKMGSRSMPRILVVIDEFQLMTQAVQEYTGSEDYRTKLENLFRLTRAMGISILLCSQTIASGLSGLTSAARDQIGGRLCMKHTDDTEIRETLVLSGSSDYTILQQAKNLTRGQVIYKRQRQEQERAGKEGAYEYVYANDLYIDDEAKKQLIDRVNAYVGEDYTAKEMILVQGGGRIAVQEKERHPMSCFLSGGDRTEAEKILCYPAAPTTLEDAFMVELDRTSGSNLLMVGEDNELRESIAFHSVCSFLMNPLNRVTAVFINETYSGRERMQKQLQEIHSDRLTFAVGVREVLGVIYRLRKIRPSGENQIFLWYGLEKLKNDIFLMNQEEDDEIREPMSASDKLDDLFATLQFMTQPETPKKVEVPAGAENLSYENCRDILLTAFDAGPENGYHHFAIFNNRKAVKNAGMIKLEQFEKRFGTRMSQDDSYDLFGSGRAINKADQNTVIYYAGSGTPIPLRPYRMPEEAWIAQFNDTLKEGE